MPGRRTRWGYGPARSFVAAALVVGAWGVFSNQRGLAQRPADRDPLAVVAAVESAVQSAIARAERSVVAIARYTPDRRTTMQRDMQADDLFLELQMRSLREPPPPLTSGTGVIIDPAGLILTQYTLIDPERSHLVTTIDGKSYEATIKAADPRSGLAVLEIDASGLPAIAMGDASKLHKGQFVVAIGNPHAIVSDGQPTASWGIVSNLARKVGADVNMGDPDSLQSTLHQFGTLIQTDARLTFGTGGGALVNLRGEMVGLTTSAASIAGHELPAGYAVPINDIFRRIIDTLKAGREVEYGLLGIQFDPNPIISTPDGVPGVAVSSVPAGGPAARAGLRTGDVVTHVNGEPVPNPDRLQLIVGTIPPDQPTTVRFTRAGAMQTAQVVLAKFPVTGRKVVSQEPPAWRGMRVDFTTAVNPRELGDDAVEGTLDPEGCVIVREVEKDSPAWDAGVRPGMMISHVGDQRVSRPGEFRAAVEKANGAINIRITPLAGGAQFEAGDDDVRQIPAPR